MSCYFGANRIQSTSFNDFNQFTTRKKKKNETSGCLHRSASVQIRYYRIITNDKRQN